jgi:hypothetical protein
MTGVGGRATSDKRPRRCQGNERWSAQGINNLGAACIVWSEKSLIDPAWPQYGCALAQAVR